MFPTPSPRRAPSPAPSRPVRRAAGTTLRALLLLLAVPAAALAQADTATVSGRVLDATSGEPIGFASVVFENVESGETSTGTLTGEDGRFLVQGLVPAEYTIWTSFPGFLTMESGFLVGESTRSTTWATSSSPIWRASRTRSR